MSRRSVSCSMNAGAENRVPRRARATPVGERHPHAVVGHICSAAVRARPIEGEQRPAARIGADCPLPWLALLGSAPLQARHTSARFSAAMKPVCIGRQTDDRRARSIVSIVAAIVPHPNSTRRSLGSPPLPGFPFAPLTYDPCQPCWPRHLRHPRLRRHPPACRSPDDDGSHEHPPRAGVPPRASIRR